MDRSTILRATAALLIAGTLALTGCSADGLVGPADEELRETPAVLMNDEETNPDEEFGNRVDTKWPMDHNTSCEDLGDEAPDCDM